MIFLSYLLKNFTINRFDTSNFYTNLLLIGIVPLVVRPPLIGVAFLGFSDLCVEKGACMPEKKVLPVLI